MKPLIRIFDGNNVFGQALHPRATSYEHLIDLARELHMGADQLYWIFDGVDSRKQRREIYPDYKIHRITKPLDLAKYEVLNLLKKEGLKQIGGLVAIEVPYWEADDIIAEIVKRLAGTARIEVHSTDADLKQLESYIDVRLPHANFPHARCDATNLRLYKTLVGDSSDNIKGLPGFGKKAWENLTSYEMEIIERALKIGDINYIDALTNSKLEEKIKTHWPQIQLCWKLVGFIDVPALHFNSANVVSYPKLQPRPLTVD